MGSRMTLSVTTIISLNRIARLVFVVDKCCAFFAAGREFVDVIWTSFGFKGLCQSSETILGDMKIQCSVCKKSLIYSYV
jgi:hypothetical protein